MKKTVKEMKMKFSDFCTSLKSAFPMARFVSASPALDEHYDDGTPVSLQVGIWNEEPEEFFKEKAGFSRYDGWVGLPGLIAVFGIRVNDPYETSTNVPISFEEYGDLKTIDWSDVVVKL